MKNYKGPLRDIDISIANYSEEEKEAITLEVSQNKIEHLQKGLLACKKRIKGFEEGLEELSRINYPESGLPSTYQVKESFVLIRKLLGDKNFFLDGK